MNVINACCSWVYLIEGHLMHHGELLMPHEQVARQRVFNLPVQKTLGCSLWSPGIGHDGHAGHVAEELFWSCCVTRWPADRSEVTKESTGAMIVVSVFYLLTVMVRKFVDGSYFNHLQSVHCFGCWLEYDSLFTAFAVNSFDRDLAPSTSKWEYQVTIGVQQSLSP